MQTDQDRTNITDICSLGVTVLEYKFGVLKWTVEETRELERNEKNAQHEWYATAMSRCRQIVRVTKKR